MAVILLCNLISFQTLSNFPFRLFMLLRIFPIFLARRFTSLRTYRIVFAKNNLTLLRTISLSSFCLPRSAKGIFPFLFSCFPPSGFSYCVMTTLAQASSSGGRRSSVSPDELPVWYPPPYDVTTYIRDYAEFFNALRFSKLPNVGTTLVTVYGPVVHNMLIGA